MRVKFFAHLQSFTGCEEVDLPVSSAITQDEFWKALEEKFPGILSYRKPTRLARNFAYADADTTFREGDEIALIPPVSGG
jgi:molybdopterin converting factor subunit 1